jgi:hypothetical protein
MIAWARKRGLFGPPSVMAVRDRLERYWAVSGGCARREYGFPLERVSAIVGFQS